MQAALPGAFLPPIKLLVLLPRLCLERQDTRLIVQSQTVKRKCPLIFGHPHLQHVDVALGLHVQPLASRAVNVSPRGEEHY